MTNNDIVQKLWNLCDVLRDNGINYSDYVTELVLLLFIKMVHENTEAGMVAGKYPAPPNAKCSTERRQTAWPRLHLSDTSFLTPIPFMGTDTLARLKPLEGRQIVFSDN